MTKDESKPLLPQYTDETERGRGYSRPGDSLTAEQRSGSKYADEIENTANSANSAAYSAAYNASKLQTSNNLYSTQYSHNYLLLNDNNNQLGASGHLPNYLGHGVSGANYPSSQRFTDKLPSHPNTPFRNSVGEETYYSEQRHHSRKLSNNPRDQNRERDRSRGPYDSQRDRSRGPPLYHGGLESPSRRYSQSDLKQDKNPKPLFQRLISNHYTVSNPYSADFGIGSSSNLLLPQHTGDNASLLSFDVDEQQRRLSVLNILRPQKLIGSFRPVCNWSEYVTTDYKSSKKSVIKYYEDQNFLIEKFIEIDNFLDAGRIHYNMLSNYDEHNPLLKTHMEEEIDEEEEVCEDEEVSVDENGTNKPQNGQQYESTPLQESSSKASRFYIAPGNIDNDGAKLLGFDEEKENSDVVFAILVNFFINILLLIGKIVVAMLTDSISVIASLVDSILDFLSTFIIYIANKLSTKKNWKIQHAYPVGRSRLEPLGVLVFSIVIIISFFQVGQESFKRLFFPTEKSIANIGFDAIAIMTITIVAKIGCWIWCSKSKNSSVQALAQDAMTDIVFNTVSVLMPTIGHFLKIWWLDPLGALALSIYIIISWAHTAFEHIDKLTGAVADPLDYKVILYLAYRFAEPIKLITALKVYHVGDNVSVEIDIVFAINEFDLSFKDCHDIAEALQYAIETLPMVERAFVHIDYMEGNFKGHLK